MPSSKQNITTLKQHIAIWIAAIREGFIALLPLTMLGAVALMLAELTAMIQAKGSLLWLGPEVVALGQRIFSATMGIMGFVGAASIAARACTLLSAREPTNSPPQIMVASVAGAGFVMCVAPTGVAGLDVLGYGNVLYGIVTGLATAEISCAVTRRLPRDSRFDGLEGRTLLAQALHMSWIAALTTIIALTFILSFAVVLRTTSAVCRHAVEATLNWFNPGAVLLNGAMTVFNQLAWMLGVNGGQLLIDMSKQGMLPIAGVHVLWADSLATPMFMNAFAHLGGAGATWGLILAILWRSRDAGIRRLSQLSMAPALVNVNETLLFGLPIVFNPILLLPFVLAPTVNVLIAGYLVNLGALNLAGGAVVWSTPVLVSGVVLTQSIWGGVLQLVLILVDALIYAPFVARLELSRRVRMETEFKSSLKTLLAPPRFGERLLDRTDAVGDIARRLMQDFSADLRGNRLALAYQPQHAIGGEVVGIEALLRWDHARFGLIPPAAVVNVAEECDLIHELGKWVVAEACNELSRLQREGFRGLTMGINMSPVQLESPDWPQHIADAIRQHDLRPQDLDIEITEGRTLSTTPQSDATLIRLQQLGVNLSMDDFGMGCTSLLYMQRFKMHAIKLDGALTREVLTNSVNQDIVRSVVRLGHSQGVKVIAEFVENVAQRDLLRELGCDNFQGWLYSKALPRDELRTYLAQSAVTSTRNGSELGNLRRRPKQYI